jgi:SAM-dependent methyltransferase
MSTVRERERAEVERSRLEACHTVPRSLQMDERQAARYLDPPLDSVFPLEHAFALLGDIRGLTVLDFGCGTGANSLLLARRGANVIGVDISTELAELARRRLEKSGHSGATDFVVGSAHDLPLVAGSVDVVLGIAVLHHLNLAMAGREVFRVLKNGGRAVFQEPVRDLRTMRAVRKLVPYRAPDVSPFERPLTSSEIRQFAAPFHIDSIRAFSLPFVSIASIIPPLKPHISSVYRLDGALLRALPFVARFAATRVFALSKR